MVGDQIATDHYINYRILNIISLGILYHEHELN